ncbi:glucan 1,4-alpha-maltotetraohydrolase domain-containing protein [Marinoscillum sp.]|uniref:glucan 1,4-alpha-maltotetraohydrolase domain-containing protein n=1 Tax=Marinoscillum sp. TaxID=2024838 RepID=UPI003BAB849C
MMKKQLLTICLAVMTLWVTAQVPNDDRVLLQGFYWEASHDYTEDWYEYVEAKAADMDAAGIDMIWLPPPSNAGSLEGYLPRELNNFANNYGTLSEHQSLLSTLDGLGIEAIADIVINHRVGSTNWVDFTNPTWGTNAITADDEVWSQPAYSSIGLRGNNDTGTPYAAARDVDHTQTFVQNDIKAFLDNLKAIGYDGWRYDFVHGFDPYYFTVYNGHTNPTFSVGENWNQDKQVVQDWIDDTGSTAFDFSTYYSLKGVIRDNNYSYLAYQGSPAGGIGWDPKNYTTFIENHDTPDYDPNNNVLNGTNVGQAYAYLLTHPGVPCIYWNHLYEWGSTVTNEIKALIQVRKEAGIHSQSPVTIHRSENGLYVASIDGDNFTVFIKMGYSNWGDPANEGMGGVWQVAASGNNYAIWKEGNGTGGGGGTTMTVYAQNYTHAYAWDNNQNPLLGSWPGTAMTSGANGWNEITINAECANVIFSYNGGSQTADLNTCDDTPYFYNGQWYGSDPLGGGSNTLTVYAQGYTHCYAWDSNGPLLGGWPGSAMSSTGNGWNSITIQANCSNVIFSYNGGGQTADLYTCGPEAYWQNGSWSSSARVAFFQESFEMYPNPFFGEASISFRLEEESGVQLDVFNASGQSVQLLHKRVAKGDHQVALYADQLPPSKAMYIVRLTVNGEVFTKKLIVK